MENKYNKIISKIEVSEELKNTIVQKMQEEELKRKGISFKLKRAFSSIMGALGIMACSGAVFAAVTGMFKIGERGIIFSEEYANYEEKVENQFVEKEGTRIELVSKMCDDGFVVLQFEVELSDTLAEDEYGMDYLSFNDKIIYENNYKNLNLAGANYNLIIDGEEYYLKGCTDKQIIENVKNKKYTVYQLYFLPSDIVENKEYFTLTLNDVIIARVPDEGEFFEMDGSFEIEVSKQKAQENTKTIKNEDANVTFGRLTNKIERVSQTPMQAVIKVKSLFTDVTTRNTYYLPADDYIGNLSYKVYDQDNNELFVYNALTEYEYYWEDGRVKTVPASEIGVDADEVGYYKYSIEEYIVTEKNKNIKSLRIEIFEKNEYKGITRNIGNHFIDLEKEKITCKNKNEIIEGAENALKDYDTKGDFLVEDIEYFDIEIDEKYDYEITSHYYGDYEHRINDYGEDFYNWIDTTEQECEIIIYNIDFLDVEHFNQDFEIVLFKEKNLYNIYSKEKGIFLGESIVVDENSEYILAVFMTSEVGKLEKIKDIIDTMKLNETIMNNDYIILYDGFEIGIESGYFPVGGYDIQHNIKETKTYYNYKDGKYIGELTGEDLLKDKSKYQEDKTPTISTTRKYDAIPREYEIINEIPEKLSSLNNDDVIKVEINKIDLDGDGEEEYVCSYVVECKTGDNSDMYEYELLKSYVQVFNKTFDKIGSLIQLESDSDIYLSLKENVEYFDLDNNGSMEILIEIPGWEETSLEIFRYNEKQMEGNTGKTYYANWRHGI